MDLALCPDIGRAIVDAALRQTMEWLGWASAAWGWFTSHVLLWRGYEDAMQSLLLYGLGIAVFTTLVFAFFCQNLSRRDAFLSHEVVGTKGRLLRGAEFTFLFPALSFLFFALLASSLFLLAKSQSTTQILLVSMSVVVGVRMTAFVSENSAADLAKLLPLSLLGVLLVDPSYASLERTWAHFAEVPGLLPLIARLVLLLIAVEVVTRTLRLGVIRVKWALRRSPRAGPLVDFKPEP